MYELVINGAVVPSATLMRQQIPLHGMMLDVYSGRSPATYALFAWTTVTVCRISRYLIDEIQIYDGATSKYMKYVL